MRMSCIFNAKRLRRHTRPCAAAAFDFDQMPPWRWHVTRGVFAILDHGLPIGPVLIKLTVYRRGYVRFRLHSVVRNWPQMLD